MSLPDVDFSKIRSYDGSQNTAFEELCSQLAALESATTNSNFFRKGRGADAGVECFRVKADSSEIGWQAKYLFTWDNSLEAQLNDSIQAALKKHPKLNEYIVCLPFDLPDARIHKSKSARQKWSNWQERWVSTVRAEGRKISIKLWGKSELASRLMGDNEHYSGRVLYWFGVEAFTASWFSEQFARTKAALGTRYTPDTNVELPIRQDFLAFTRYKGLQKQIDDWFVRVSDESQSAIDAIKQASAVGAEPHSAPLKVAIEELTRTFGVAPLTSEKPYPLDVWDRQATQCLDLAEKAMRWVRNLPALPSKNNSGVSPARWAQIKLQALAGTLTDISDAATSQRWKLANARAALLTGPAGIGKSHLLADIVEHQIHEGCPAILLLGSSFRDDEPWRQILAQLDRPLGEQIKHFLGALDAAAQAAGTRALVCIDALNERHGIDIWPDRLAAFLKTAESFPRIGVILSCRLTYIQYVIPKDLDENLLIRIRHQGFAADGGQAAKIYLDKRGFVRSGAPNLVPEFDNPLFLKTCCDYLEREGKSEFPRGLRGVTSIFNFYSAAVTKALNKRMGLDPHFEIIPKTISSFAQMLASSGEGYIEKSKVIDLFESTRPSDGKLEKSLLSQLESEGFLTVEPIWQEDGPVVELVRFTFERFSDHAIAQQLLNEHLNKDNAAASFEVGKPLHSFVFGSKCYAHSGVIEAIAIQLSERVNFEILDVCDKSNWAVKQAFIASLLWRESMHFTNRTFELARQNLSRIEFVNLLIAISPDPLNKFNAAYLHAILKPKTMPDRDESWSAHVAELGYSGNIEALISWSLNNGFEEIEDDRAYLIGVILTWLLTTTNRAVRDKATKGLACILARRFQIAARLLHDFISVNDPYVLERLLAACYGAALQGNATDLGKLAATVFKLVFSGGNPPVDALLRDHARGIIEYANWRGVLPDPININLARPPYKSPWPIEYVSSELIETYTETRPNGTYRDAIVGSTVNDGDFARYQLDHKVGEWSPMPLGTSPLPTAEEIYSTWSKDFSKWASSAQLVAFDKMLAAAKKARHVGPFGETEESKLRDSAMAAFKALLSADQWEEFRVSAESFVLYQMYMERQYSPVAAFNAGWARRWVCKRAHELGWTANRFGEFDDRKSSHDRHDHHIERIGKKYQWIALRELIARMADNLAFIGKSWNREDEAQTFQGAWQINLRDIDPSLLVTETHFDSWVEWQKTWWVPVSPILRPIDRLERRAWAKSDSDIINSDSLIEVANPKTGIRWLNLWGFSHWRGRGIRDGHREMQRETWFRLQCIVVSKKEEKTVIRKMRSKILVDPHVLPKIDLFGEFYLGEYPWHPALKDVGQKEPFQATRNSATGFIQPTVATYTCERGGYDYSVDKTVSIKIPAPWLADAMGLRMASGKIPAYVNSVGREIFYDPSLREAGPSAALVDRDGFLEMLDREKLSAIWVVAGEKSAYGGQDAGLEFGGRLHHTAIYRLEAGGFKKMLKTEWLEPSDAQLAKFFGEDRDSNFKSDACNNAARRPRIAIQSSKRIVKIKKHAAKNLKRVAKKPKRVVKSLRQDAGRLPRVVKATTQVATKSKRSAKPSKHVKARSKRVKKTKLGRRVLKSSQRRNEKNRT